MGFKTGSIKFAASMILASAAAAAFAQPAALPERVEVIAKERVASGTYPTLVFGIVDGDKSAVRAFGTRDSGQAPDGDTVYEIGSITKTFTATLLAEAVLAGRVTLDTPVQWLVPGFKIPERDGKPITLGLLASQHSGLPRMPYNFRPKDPANPYVDYGETQLGAFLASYELPRDPGQSYEYSNLGFGLLGYALAASAHTSYDDLAARELLRPLGMRSSGTSLTEPMRTHLAIGHDIGGHPVANWDFDALSGAGSLRSTANDMLRYLKANMGVAQSPASAAMRLAQTPRLDARETGGRIGLAWMTTDKGIVWHNGGTGGYRSFIGWSADRRHGVVVLTNSLVSVDDFGFAVLDAAATLEPAHKVVALPAVALDQYVGTYKLAEKFLLKVFRAGDQLMTQASGQGAVPVYPSGPDEFFIKVVPASMTFTRNAQGQVSGLVLHQGGDHPAPKLSAAELPPEPKAIALDPATLPDYIGAYRFDSGAPFEVILHDGQLEARLGAQSAFPIYASARDRFFYKIVDAQLDFERDVRGKVIAVVLHQNGNDQRATRVLN
ncbi:MAG: serine hydrolase [Paucibacter sp.]|nr:serine hydrolase [Roseateles sp.]